MALYFDEYYDNLINELGEDETGGGYAQRDRSRVVLLLCRADGRGGIQGIVLDSFYIDRDGNIANEFYVVSDATEGDIKKIEDDSIKQLQDPAEVQKAFYKYFVQQ